MSDLNDYLLKQEGAASAARAGQASPASDSDWLGGFISSAASTIPEMFGQNPTQRAQDFRTQNPWSGVASELLPTFGVYGGIAKASEAIPAVASGLENVVARTGLTALENPISYGAVKEMARYAPFELGRLGIGLLTAPSDNYGNLFADVGLSELLAGGFGGIGGYFRGSGPATPQAGEVVGSDLGLKPSFKLRMSLDPNAQVTGDVPMSEMQNQWLQDAFDEHPMTGNLKGTPLRYVNGLKGGTPETDDAVNGLFRANSGQGPGWSRQKLNALTPDELQPVLGAAGFDSTADAASTMVYPRLLTVNSERGAGSLAKLLDDVQGVSEVEPGTWMGRENGDGLYVIGRRVKSAGADVAADMPNSAPEGAATPSTGSTVTAAAPKTFGAANVAPGDQWLWFKTDKPNRFLPDAAKVAELNFNKWAKLQEVFQPAAKTDVFNQGMDVVGQVLSPADYNAMQRTTKASTLETLTKKAAKVVYSTPGLDGILGGETAQKLARFVTDAAFPTQFREGKNSLYGRLWTMLNASFNTGDRLHQQLMQEAAPLWKSISERGDLDLIMQAAQTQTPAEDLAKLSANGLVSAETTADYQALQALDAKAMREHVLPTLANTDVAGQFTPLEGYIAPRAYPGEWFQTVLDADGRKTFLANGKTGAAAQAQAKAVIDEAAAKGMVWKAEPITHAAMEENDALAAVSDMVSKQIGRNRDAMDVVQAGLRRFNAAKGAMAQPSRLRTSSAFKERTGLPGAPDKTAYTLKDVITSVSKHYDNLYKFAGYHAFTQRWGGMINNLSSADPTLGEDIARKAAQAAGSQGSITKTINKTLAPVLGSHGASKISAGINKALYAWNIGIANPTFALVNVLQPLQTLAPLLSFAVSAAPESVTKMLQFVPKMTPEGRMRGVMGFLHPMKVMGEAVRMSRSPTAEEAAAMLRARSEHVFEGQTVEDWIGPKSRAATTLADSYKQGGMVEFLKKSSTWMATKSESFSRMVAFNSWYLLGRDHFGLEGDKLFQLASRGTRLSMYGYRTIDKSRMFTGPIGSMAGLFKNWQFHYIGQMAQYANLALKGEAFGPLMWQGASALALGGLGATPLKGLADGLAAWNSDSPDSYTWMKEHWHGAADEIYFGLPALLGLSLQSSVEIPGTDVRNDITNLGNFAFLTRAQAIGKALGNAWQVGTSGDENALRDPNVRDQLMAAVAPRAIFKAFSAAEGDYVKNMTTGYPSVRDVGPGARLFTSLGFNTTEVASQQNAAQKLYLDQEATKSAVQGIGQAYANAYKAQDFDEMDRLVQRAVGLHLPVSSVMASANSRLRRETVQDNLSRYKGEKAAAYISALGD